VGTGTHVRKGFHVQWGYKEQVRISGVIRFSITGETGFSGIMGVYVTQVRIAGVMGVQQYS
jgi:hypothetical protein